MSIELYWDDEAETVMLMEITGKWSWNDLFETMQTIQKISKQRHQTFGAIIDLSQGVSLPSGGFFNSEGLSNFRKLTQLDNGNKGPVVFVGMNGMFKSVFQTAGSLDPNFTKMTAFVNTMSEAQAKIYGMMKDIKDKAS
jgi:hypothetical protein